MSEPSRREDQPLLYDSGEEDSMVCSSHRWSPRRGSAGSRGRAAGKMRGVATVMTKWPDHISSSIHKCWMIVFFTVLTFIITYGVVMTVYVLPNNQFRFGRGLINERTKYKSDLGKLSENIVFCPIIVNAREHVNFTIYINSLKSLKRSFPKYDYNLIVLANVTNKRLLKRNNALESILSQDELSIIEKANSNDKSLIIEKHLLSKFMDSSPLKKEWRSLDKTLMPFLIKSIVLWENGGIAFDLKTMIEDNNNTIKEEVEKVLRDFAKEKSQKPIHLPNNFHKENVSNSNEVKSTEKPINNIRDVIDNLEKNPSKSLSLVILTSEESEISHMKANKIKRSLTLDTISDEAKLLFDSGNRSEENKISTSNNTNVSPSSDKLKANLSSNVHTLGPKDKLSDSVHNLELENGSNATAAINDRLPQFLVRLFKAYDNLEGKDTQDNSTNIKLNILSKPSNKTLVTQKRATVSSKDFNPALLNEAIITIGKEYKNGMESDAKKESIVNSKSGKSANVKVGNYQKTTEEHKTTELHEGTGQTLNVDENLNLILDMSGNLIATKVSCHAFIGQIFSTIQKYPNLKSTKKLIDKAMKIFCHAKTRSGCTGIKLLL